VICISSIDTIVDADAVKAGGTFVVDTTPAEEKRKQTHHH
jgi:hypothetical protein